MAKTWVASVYGPIRRLSGVELAISSWNIKYKNYKFCSLFSQLWLNSSAGFPYNL